MDDVAALGYQLLAKFRNSRGQKNLILSNIAQHRHSIHLPPSATSEESNLQSQPKRSGKS